MKELLKRYPNLSCCEQDIQNALQILIDCYESKNKLMTCGNGGSCADADHIVGELMKGFLKKRPLSAEQKYELKANYPEIDDIIDDLQQGLPCVSLCFFAALNTAFGNDVDSKLIFAQGVLGLGRKGDVLLCISTSGNAENVFAAAKIAKAMGITVIALTGESGGKIGPIADACIRVPETETYKVQELHLPIYHYLCASVENHFFSE